MSIERVHVIDEGHATTTTSLADYAYQHIQDRLIRLDIRPGAPINDVGLAAELNVGRTPVREALKRLETDYLVVSYPRRGTFATRVDVTELGAISDLRQLLEPHAARRAAEHASATQRAEMSETAGAIRHLEVVDGDWNTLIKQDMAIHQLIYRSTSNPHLQDVLIRYDNLATRIWCLVLHKLPDLAGHVREHSALLEAISDGNGDQAAALAHAHVSGFDRAIRSVL